MKKQLLLSLIILLVVLPTDWAESQIPRVFNYQGSLRDDKDRPMPDASYPATFAIYENEEGGSPIWVEIQDVLTVNGFFNVFLGTRTAIKINFDRQYWLEVKFGDGAPFRRTPLSSVPTALNTIHAIYSDTSQITMNVLDGSITQAKLAPNISAYPWGPAGGDLSGTYPNPTINPATILRNIPPGSITRDKLAPNLCLTPCGPALGDLTGEYPDPVIAPNAVTSDKIRDGNVTYNKLQKASAPGMILMSDASNNWIESSYTADEKDPIWIAAKAEATTITGDWIIAGNFDNTANPWADNEVANDLTIDGGTINNTPIGSNSPSTGQFTNINILGELSFDGGQSVDGIVTSIDAVGSNTNIPTEKAVRDAIVAATSSSLEPYLIYQTSPNLTNGRVLVGGDGLTFDVPTATLSVNVDGTSLEIDNDVLAVKNLGISTAKIADNAVTTTKLADESVTTSKLADASVTASKIADGSIATSKIADGAITTSKIADGAISTAKLEDAAVTTAKISDGAVTNAKIANSTDFVNIQDANGVTQFLIDNADRSLRIEATGDINLSFVPASNKIVFNFDVPDIPIDVSNEPILVWDPATNLPNSKIIKAGQASEIIAGPSDIIFNVLYDDATIGLDGSNSLYLKDNAVTTSKIGINAVTTEKIAENSVTYSKIQNATAPGMILVSNGLANSWVESSFNALETDPQVNMTNINAVPRWDGTSLVDGTIIDNGTSLATATQDFKVVGDFTLEGLTAGSYQSVLVVDPTGMVYKSSNVGSYTNIIDVSSNYTALASDGTILVNCAGGNVIITLPIAESVNKGLRYQIKKVDITQNKLIIRPAAGTIDGTSEKITMLPWSGFVVQSNGNAWFVIGIF